MVPRKRMRAGGYSMCTRVCEQTLQHARQGRTLDYSPNEWQQLMLVSFVQADVACNTTAPSVCTLVLFINPRCACAARTCPVRVCVYISVCVSVCVFVPQGTGASRRLTEGISGLSGTFFTKVKWFFLKLLR